MTERERSGEDTGVLERQAENQRLTDAFDLGRRKGIEACMKVAVLEQDYWREREHAGLASAENVEFNIRKLLDRPDQVLEEGPCGMPVSPVHDPDHCMACKAVEARTRPSPEAQPRFFIEHDVIHDRVTGKHVRTTPRAQMIGGEDAIEECCQLLNDLAETSDAGLERELIASGVNMEAFKAKVLASTTHVCRVCGELNWGDCPDHPNLARTRRRRLAI